jgi:glycosyltransferase involved in cell wall biosynthesis
LESKLKALLFKFKRYDVVIIGLHGLSPDFCLKSIKSECYVQFLRNDLSECDDEGKAKRNIQKYGAKINYYIAVSQTAKDSFIELFPNLSHKVKKIYNLIEAETIIEKANKKINSEDVELFSNEDFIILTVCRIQDKSKALFRMADVFKKLTNEISLKIKWVIIGDGLDIEDLEQHITALDLQDKMMLLGHRNNPYPYFLKTNLVAVLSYYEGLCGVVNEAKVLQRPLIATEFSGIHEQIQHKSNGFVVENNEDSIYNGLKYLLNNRALLDKMSVNNMPQSITNDDYKIEQLESLFAKKNE